MAGTVGGGVCTLVEVAVTQRLSKAFPGAQNGLDATCVELLESVLLDASDFRPYVCVRGISRGSERFAGESDPARDALDHHQGAAPKCRPLAAALRLPAAFASE